MFAAAIPQPAHNMPGGTLATGIRDALTASSFRAHMARDSLACLPGKSSDETPAPKKRRKSAPVAAPRALPEPSSVPALLWGVLTTQTPPEARGLRCVDAREVHRLGAPDRGLGEFLSVCLPLAGVEPVTPWRVLRDWGGGISTTNAGPIWLNLKELDRVLSQIPGHEAKRFRIRLRRGGWRPMVRTQCERLTQT